ncbi:MAG: CbbQ/NirQ/NorQ/GpvN family protein [Dehalococcoidia bacterium]|nr:CbbQ/NirQ/NorQ/GpvN family protein [Dehalococcoidia bacterium]MDD5493277.1 CbbQ/NirQ/NorQ/GpvN family protein [Dehalococcoidia bacterium]
MPHKARRHDFKSHIIEEYYITEEPFYLPLKDEIQLFEAAYAERIPVLLKGPTGCGKTRFLEYMTYHMSKKQHRSTAHGETAASHDGIPLITIACHEDLTASDLVGKYLLEGDVTRWVDGPLTRAVKSGGICYLDEVVEARKDTIVLIHPLADHRRSLYIEKKGEMIEASDSFMLVISYNPGYQSILKNLKHSTRQRFIAIEFTHPPKNIESKIIEHEAGIGHEVAEKLARLGEKIRNLKEQDLSEVISTRLLIYAARLIKEGISPRRACEVAAVWSITDDQEVQKSLKEVVTAIFE